MTTSRPHLLNLGCGARVHPAWINVDVRPTAPGVIVADLRRGVPFGPDSFDAVYMSHVLEHFDVEDGAKLIHECLRVVRPGGIIRVVVPNLEEIARRYLECLREARAGAPGADFRYDWMVVELYDQVVRTRSGGAMAEMCRRATPPERDFIRGRLGVEANGLFEAQAPSIPGGRAPIATRFRGAAGTLGSLRAIRRVMGAMSLQGSASGDPRHTGELHRWMYDAFSVTRLLQRCGFERARVVGPTESEIPGWASFQLDAGPDAVPHKPDSLFVEATKPQPARRSDR
jgi:SAM-dependent methyltransferase